MLETDPALRWQVERDLVGASPEVWQATRSRVATEGFGARLLALQGVDSVVLCGATTSGCIRATAIDLLQYSWPTIVPRECVGDRAQAPHEANLFDIQAKYADVVSVDDALAYLETVPERVGVA